MAEDDRQRGRLLTRREVVAILGAGSGALIVTACAPAAISTSQFFFEERHAEVHANEPYASCEAQDTTSARGIYLGGGSHLRLVPARSAAGYAATLDVEVVI